MISNRTSGLALFILLLLVVSYWFYQETITLFPSSIHAWTQSDRYALALGFIQNGFDFFHPKTFCLSTVNGITQVDFPIHEYIVAIIMRVTGNTDPVFFRCYTLVYGIVGLCFLFNTILRLTSSIWLSFLIPLIVLSSPVFTYYLNGFIPSVTSFSNFLISLFFYLCYLQNQKRNSFLFAITFMTLASLSRMTFCIFLLAMSGVHILSYLKNKKIVRFEVLTFSISFLLIVTYAIYNSFLLRKYGTIFLRDLTYASTLEEFVFFISETWRNWNLHYFTLPIYITLILAVGIVVLSLYKKGKSLQILPVIQYFIFSLLGTIFFIVLMVRQFKDHDYYFIDTMLPVVTLFLCISAFFISNIKSKVISVSLKTSFSLLVILALLHNYELQTNRNTVDSWDRVEITRKNFEGSERWLDSLGISKVEKIVVIDSYTPNIPFILMNREGYPVMSTTKAAINSALQLDAEYYIIQDQFLFSDVIAAYPEIPNILYPVASTNRITLYKKWNHANHKANLNEFLNITPERIKYFKKVDFESNIPPQFWNNYTVTEESSHNNVHRISPENEYGLSFSVPVKDLKLNSAAKVLLTFKGYFIGIPKEVSLVGALNRDGNQVLYESNNLKNQVKEGSYTELSILFNLPDVSREDVLTIYFWNNGKADFSIDDLELTVYYN